MNRVRPSAPGFASSSRRRGLGAERQARFAEVNALSSGCRIRPTMFLAADIGNSRTQLALLDESGRSGPVVHVAMGQHVARPDDSGIWWGVASKQLSCCALLS